MSHLLAHIFRLSTDGKTKLFPKYMCKDASISKEIRLHRNLFQVFKLSIKTFIMNIRFFSFSFSTQTQQQINPTPF